MRSGKGVKQLPNQLFNGALFLLLSLQYIHAEGNVGCLYSNQLCDKKTEWCFNDFAFGRCVYRSDFTPDDLYRYKFSYYDLEKLKGQLKELKSLGFNWKDGYTQCIIQTQLEAVKLGLAFTAELCVQTLEQEFPGTIQLPQSEPRNVYHSPDKHFESPQAVSEGIVKFEPDERDRPVSNTGTYYKGRPDGENDLINQLRLEAETKPDVHKKSRKSTSARYRGTPLYLPPHNRQNIENEIIKSEEDIYDRRYEPIDNEKWVLPAENTNYDDLRSLRKTLDILDGERGKTYTEGGPMYISDKKNEYENAVYNKILNQYGSYGPDIFGFQRSERLDVKKPGPPYKVNDYAFRNMNLKSAEVSENRPEESVQNVAEELVKKVHRNVNSEKTLKEQKSEYEYVPSYGHALRSENLQSPSQYVTIETNNKNLSRPQATKLLGTIRNLRRLPAGIFRNIKIHNDRIIYFNVRANIINYSATDISRIIGETIAESPIEGFDITAVYVGLPREIAKNEQQTTVDDTVSCDADDSEFALLQLSKNSDSWMEADVIVRHLNTFFKLPPETFYCIKSSGSNIAFKVRNNSRGLNASKVADIINTNTDKINSKLHIEVMSAGIRSHDHPTVLHLSPESENGYFKLSVIMCGVIAAVLISTIALFYAKRQTKLKEKLNGIPRDKDLNKNHHQDPNRNRINSKPIQEISVPGQRITSLSRESDNSPSSRSSTSSWSEDPMTNMDVTTGHMVLAYMEDHLTNKARLDTEWAALCAYDADPCSVAISQQTENIRKNRYVNALPYDHARVVLNALSNVNGSDYINASTITDHDPRNPAYIATQGPLENTVCDFWQMLWEQGCNIVVMLTRLIENDTAMCHRYWPSEGVELYNIYEVHLVSEHIWCDDFIVRSFYLKNQVTTETRTITQFHFLAWPEGGIPPAARSLLEFRRKVNKSFREKNHPIVVHCSDGVGRTGSYLLLDMVLNRISKGAKEIDIAATLEHIRDQRAGAVCTKQQFQFVLSAVAEEVQAVLKALPQQQQSAQEQNMDNVAPLVQLSTDPVEQVATTSGTMDKVVARETASNNTDSILN